MKKITHAWLKKMRACEEELQLFRELYPKGIAVCWACFQEAQRKGLSVDWLCTRFHDVHYSDIIYMPREGVRVFPELAKRFERGEWVTTQLSPDALKLIEKYFHKNYFV